MRLFKCQICGQRIYFDNTRCERCGTRVGYLPDIGLMSALDPVVGQNTDDMSHILQQAGLEAESTAAPAAPQPVWNARVRPGMQYRSCANAVLGGCNWMIPASDPSAHCRACRHDRAVSDLADPVNAIRWRKLEQAKRWLFYSLVKLQLPLPTRQIHPDGLAFDFLADPTDPAAPPVITGHLNGLVTVALREADDVERERMREALGEPYRTLLGHLRHEIGHFFWVKLVRNAGHLDACRAVFGDDRASYAEALQRYYTEGPRPGWPDTYVSAYATMHPWEDFAETWAHYLHMVDTLETAVANGVRVQPRDGSPSFGTDPEFEPYRTERFQPLIDNWLPLSLAANSLTRSMGQRDFYPFVLSAPAIEKLAFVHGLIQMHRLRVSTDAAAAA